MTMTLADDALMLTDDEIAAVALSLRRPWPAALPTVGLVPEEIIAAATRGLRAMAVRGLMEPVEDNVFGRPVTAVRDLLGSSLESGLRCAVLTTGADLVPLEAGPAYYHFGSDSDLTWLTDAVRLAGVHALARLDRVDCVDLVIGLLAQAWRSTEVSGSGEWLCVLGPQESRRAVLAGPGELRRHILDGVNGEAVVSTRVEDALSVDEAFTWLDITA